MSETIMSGHNDDWLHFYDQPHNTFPVPPLLLPDATTTAAPPGNGAAPQLSPEGRVSKPIRRRSRASKRTPTTLLNTDTTNFRAMVQQFTGAPFAPTASSAASGFPTIHPNGLMLAPSSTAAFQQHYMMNTYPNETQRAAAAAAASSEEGALMGHGGGGRFFTPNTSSSS